MKGTDLKPHKTLPILKLFYAAFGFVFAIGFVFFLYQYTWVSVTSSIARSMTRGVYVQKTNVLCTSDRDCRAACDEFGEGECMCLSSVCQYIDDIERFSESKFCERDSDCTVSCYEGPVSRDYYEAVNGAAVDCRDGCALMATEKPGDANIVCRDHQCAYAGGQTCFIDELPTLHQ